MIGIIQFFSSFFAQPLNPSRGFSAFKFIPFRENELVALKTQELKGVIASCLLS